METQLMTEKQQRLQRKRSHFFVKEIWAISLKFVVVHDDDVHTWALRSKRATTSFAPRFSMEIVGSLIDTLTARHLSRLCLRMESIGMPYGHIVIVLQALDLNELPKSLRLDRWSKEAREEICCIFVGASSPLESSKTSHQVHHSPHNQQPPPWHHLKRPLHCTFRALSDKYDDVISLWFGSRLVVVSSQTLLQECFTKNDVVLTNHPHFLSGKHISSTLW
ncbi:hypothetical protein JHK86_024984 [Glycine max]|nr:hypothetical protein JHK86_024984 [Glycine max]